MPHIGGSTPHIPSSVGRGADHAINGLNRAGQVASAGSDIAYGLQGMGVLPPTQFKRDVQEFDFELFSREAEPIMGSDFEDDFELYAREAEADAEADAEAEAFAEAEAEAEAYADAEPEAEADEDLWERDADAFADALAEWSINARDLDGLEQLYE